MGKSKGIVLAGCAVLALTTAETVFAQTVPAPAQVSQTPADESETGDIVVTAQKREQSINSVGLSLQAISGEALSERGVRDVADLSRVVPGFTFTPSPYATPVYTLRGVGLYDSGLASTPSVSVYVDETPLAFPIMTKGATLDLERVEVLKGPQGTLFGQSSTGGAVNYIAAKPTRDFRAGLDTRVDHFGQVDATGYVSGPLSPTLQARLATRVVLGGAWQKSTSRGDLLGDQRLYEARLLLNWEASDRARFVLNLNGYRDRSDPLAPSLLRVQPLNIDLLPPAFLNSIPARSARDADWPAGQPKADNRFAQAALRGEYDLADGLQLVALGSYQHASLDQDLPFSGTPLPYQNLKNTGHVNSGNGELRLAGTGTRLNWIVGTTYEGVSSVDSIRYDQRIVSNRQPIPTVPAFNDAVTQLDTHSHTIGIFGNLDYKLTDQLGVRAGARYTMFRGRGRGCLFDDQPGNELGQLLETLQVLFKGSFIPIPPRGCVSLDANANPTATNYRLRENNLSWRFGLDYKLAGGTLLYANYSRGFKTGIFPNVAGTAAVQYEPAREERLDAYEIGVKAPLFGRSVQFNASAFYYDYKDKQFRGTVLDTVFGKLERELNIPKSRILGAEAELTVTPWRGVRLSAAGTYLDAKVTSSFPTYTSDGIALDADGSRLPFTPRFQLVGDAEYEWPISSRFNGYAGIAATYHSKDNASLQTALVRAPDFFITDYTVVDLRAGLRGPNDTWRVGLFVQNVNDSYRWNTVFRVIDGYFRYNDRPRTFGISFSVHTN